MSSSTRAAKTANSLRGRRVRGLVKPRRDRPFRATRPASLTSAVLGVSIAAIDQAHRWCTAGQQACAFRSHRASCVPASSAPLVDAPALAAALRGTANRRGS
jgi:hypothetical protein